MGIKNIQGSTKDFEKPLTNEAIYSFESFLESHGFETKEPLKTNPTKP